MHESKKSPGKWLKIRLSGGIINVHIVLLRSPISSASLYSYSMVASVPCRHTIITRVFFTKRVAPDLLRSFRKGIRSFPVF